MSKLAIILCVAFFATATSSSSLPERFQAIRSRVESIVTSAIKAIKERYEPAKQRALDKLTKLEEEARKFSQKLIKDVSEEIKKAREKVKSIAQRVKGIDVSKCTALVNELDTASDQVYSETSGCAVEKVKIGSNYVDTLKKNTDIVKERLSELHEEGLRCGKNVTSAREALRAVVCIKLVAAKATWTAAKAVPSISGVFMKIDYLLATLRVSLSHCTASKALSKFRSYASDVIKRAEKCIQQQFAEGKKPSQNETTVSAESTPATTESSTSDGEKGSTTEKDSSTSGSGSPSGPEVSTAEPSDKDPSKDTTANNKDGTTESSAASTEKGSSATPDGTGASTSSGQSGDEGLFGDLGASKPSDKDSTTEKDSKTESSAASTEKSATTQEASTLKPSEKPTNEGSSESSKWDSESESTAKDKNDLLGKYD